MPTRNAFRVLFCGATVALGGLAIVGWLLHVPLLTSVLPGLTTMKINTALGFVTAGAALLLLGADCDPPDRRGRRRILIAALLGAVPAFAGVSSLFEYASGVRLGIDELFLSDPATTSPPFPGRMAPATATAFLGVGASILFLAWGACTRAAAQNTGRWAVTAAHLLTPLPAWTGYLALAGYVYDVHGLYSFGPFVSVALNTAIALALLVPAILLTMPDRGWRRGFANSPVALGVLSHLLPLSILVPFAAGAVVVWGARWHIYDPLFAAALFGMAAATSAAGLALFCADAVRRAEHRLRETNAALRESEARFRTMTEAMPQLAFMALPDGRVEFHNRRWCDFAGIAPEDAAPARWRALLHPDDHARTLAAWRHALASGLDYQLEHRLRDAAGQFHWFLTRAVPLRDGNGGGIVRWFGTSTDISEMVSARETLSRSRVDLEMLVAERTHELQDAQTRLAHAQRMEALGQLAGGIAHDFNNVMQSVLVAADMTELAAAQPDKVRRLARMMNEAAERGAAITRRLLVFSRRGDLRAEIVATEPLLVSLQEILTHTLGSGVTVRVDAPAGLAPLLADKGQLETVLVNLATNARDAMDGAGQLWLRAAFEQIRPADAARHPGALRPGGFVRLSVSDTGKGMTPEVLARATEPFFTTKAPGKGTGLGLSMAAGFAEQSGGGLHIDSSPGQGTTVTFWLPVAGNEAGGAVAPAAPAGGRPPAGARRVLLVDDDRSVRETIALRLETAGYGVVTARGGAEALAILDAGEAVDLIVTDLSMPDIDGLAAIREAQRRRPGLAAILLTGAATNVAEIAMDGAMSGRFTLLHKPVDGAILVERVRAMLEGVAADGKG